MNETDAIAALRELKTAMGARDRRAIVAIGRRLIDGAAPLGQQWRALAQLMHHNGEYGLANAAAALAAGQVAGVASRFDQAAMLARTGRLGEAAALAAALPDDQPSPAEIAYLRGTIALNRGDAAEARAQLERTVTANPAAGQAWLSLAMTGSMAAAEPGDALIAAAPAIADAAPIEQATYAYALGKVHHDRGGHDAAFDAFSRGAAIGARLRPYDRARDAAGARAAVAGYDAETLARLRGAMAGLGDGGPEPIFVGGLPRSGTTLVQQILVAHSAVGGGDEIGSLGHVAEMLGGVEAQYLIAALAKGRVAAPAALYRHIAAERFPGAARFVDKSLNLSRHLGLVAALFPDAPLIWVRRAPADAAWSCFRTWFAGGIEWSWSAADIAHHFRIEDALLARWQAVLGARLLVIDYAELVDAPEAVITRLMAHAGLDPEPAVFRAHEAEGAVTTASVTQVRAPINRGGLDVADRYPAFRDAFLAAYRG